MAIGASELAKTVGVSYKQIDHWSRCGYIHPQNPDPGSGIRRSYSDMEAARVLVFAALSHLGVTPSGAHTMVELGWFDDEGAFHTELHVRKLIVRIEVGP